MRNQPEGDTPMNVYRCSTESTQMLVAAHTRSEAMLKFVATTGAQPKNTRVVML